MNAVGEQEEQEIRRRIAAGEPMRRPMKCVEFDALNSILRVLEPLSPEQRERCLAAARCIYNDAAAHQAIAGLQ